ncbi:MAG: Crp/Fnr family transcriptional regulator [Firmicutes bacterium]|nr:Crp/Fnr family transcriptional regulator [Bacillota bacterium]
MRNLLTPELLKSLKGHYLFSVIDDRQTANLLECSVLRVVPAGRILWSGDDSDSLAVLLKGTLKIAVIDSGGNEFAIKHITAVDSLGDASVMGERGGLSGVYTVDECTVLFVEKNAVRSLIRSDAAAACALCRELSLRIGSLTGELKMQVFSSAETRIMHRLLQLMKPGCEEIKITQSLLAELVGITRERLTLALGKLEKEGYIVRKRGKIILKNAELMKKAVESAIYNGEE